MTPSFVTFRPGDGTICYGEFTNAFFKLGKEARAEQRKSPSHISLQYGTASEVSKIFLKRFKEKLGIGFKDGLKVLLDSNRSPRIAPPPSHATHSTFIPPYVALCS